jgi:hypothetical protein
VDPVTGEGCVGCGPQEEFYGCADIRIKPISSTHSVQDASQDSNQLKVPELIKHVDSPLLQQCPNNGFFADQSSSNCDTFYSCSSIGTRFAQAFLFRCPTGFEFDEIIHRCVDPNIPAVVNHRTTGVPCEHRFNTTSIIIKDYMEIKKNILADLIEVTRFILFNQQPCILCCYFMNKF